MKELNKPNKEITIPADKLEYLQRELTNIREEVREDKYIAEAIRVLAAGGLRSTIGSYWNAVVHDIRKKIVHRSLDLFNKEMPHLRDVKEYEDFQNHITDYELIEGAYKIGVLSWEGRKLIQQARETRNIFDGHPDSSDPTLFKVFNMIADCNRYVLSEHMPIPIIDIDQYILTMDSDTYSTVEIAVEQAFSDLPEVYKKELTNKLFTLYTKDNTSTTLSSNIEFAFPILWRVLPKEIRQQQGKRFDQLIVEGDSTKIDKGTEILSLVGGFRYVTEKSRQVIYAPQIKKLEDNLDKWKEEGEAMKAIERLGTVIPTDFVERLVKAMTLTYVGRKGSSMYFNRTDFYSNAAEPRIISLFENFDSASVDAFIETVMETRTLKNRINYTGQLRRLRSLGDILLNKPNLRKDQVEFLELLVDENRTKELFKTIKM